VQVLNQTVTFPQVSGSGPQTQSVTVTFGSAVTQAAAILTGFDVEYSGGNDHHLGRLDVELNVGAINGASVVVSIQYGLRDWSDNWDDLYDGTVSFAVIGI
jgi:hypothetical protein